MPKLYKKGKIIKQEKIHDDARKMTQRLAKGVRDNKAMIKP